jgi:hypothetical protein
LVPLPPDARSRVRFLYLANKRHPFSPIFVSDPVHLLGLGPDLPGAIRRWRAAVNIRCLSSQVQPDSALPLISLFSEKFLQISKSW